MHKCKSCHFDLIYNYIKKIKPNKIDIITKILKFYNFILTFVKNTLKKQKKIRKKLILQPNIDKTL